jgi:ABC-type nitrate/sulfonate/bicarbonate transport system permease component
MISRSAGGRSRHTRRRIVLLAVEIAVPVLMLAVYTVWASARGSIYFPTVGVIAERFVDLWIFDRVPGDLLPSLRRLLLGYGLAVVLGVTAGLALGAFRPFQQAVQPFAEFLRALPAVVLIPFAMLVFGRNDTMRVFVIMMGAVWPVLLNTVDGVRGVDAGMLEMARAYGVSRWGRMRDVVIPAALPRVVAGMRTSLSIAIILMVVTEMVGGRNGVGYLVLQSQRRFAFSDMWAGIVLLGVVGYVANFLFVRAERSLLHWHRASKGLAQ